MSAVLNFQTQLEAHNCPECSIYFAMPPRFVELRREDGKWFFCPSGHRMRYCETELDKARKQLARAQQDIAWYKASVKSKESQLKGAAIQIGKVKAKLHRTETHVANGVCPCCHRSFVQLSRHMKTKHPEYVEAHHPTTGDERE